MEDDSLFLTLLLGGKWFDLPRDYTAPPPPLPASLSWSILVDRI